MGASEPSGPPLYSTAQNAEELSSATWGVDKSLDSAFYDFNHQKIIFHMKFNSTMNESHKVHHQTNQHPFSLSDFIIFPFILLATFLILRSCVLLATLTILWGPHFIFLYISYLPLLNSCAMLQCCK